MLSIYQGDWSNATTYITSDQVSYNLGLFSSRTGSNLNHTPSGATSGGSIYNQATPGASGHVSGTYEIASRFTVSTNATVTFLRFYQDTIMSAAGTVDVNLWDQSGGNLFTTTFTLTPGLTQWNSFACSVPIVTGQTYTVSYGAVWTNYVYQTTPTPSGSGIVSYFGTGGVFDGTVGNFPTTFAGAGLFFLADIEVAGSDPFWKLMVQGV
jgi:hypothetical protein